MNTIQTTIEARYGLRIGGRNELIGCPSLADCRAAWETIKERLELGSRRSPRVTVIDLANGRTVARVAYNGRLFEYDGGPWTVETALAAKEIRA